MPPPTAAEPDYLARGGVTPNAVGNGRPLLHSVPPAAVSPDLRKRPVGDRAKNSSEAVLIDDTHHQRTVVRCFEFFTNAAIA